MVTTLFSSRSMICTVRGSEKLFNELVREFSVKYGHLSDEEFFDKCYRLFFDRLIDRNNDEGMLEWMRSDLMRSNFFMAWIFQLVADEVRKELEFRERISIVEEKDAVIKGTQDRLTEALNDLHMIYNSKTWRIMRIYAKIFGVEAKWRRNLSRLIGG